MVISSKNIRIYVTVSKETHTLLKEEADNDLRNISNLVNLIIKKHYEQKKNLPSKD